MRAYNKDSRSSSKIIYWTLPGLADYLTKVADPGKGKLYEVQQQLGTVIIENVCFLESIQEMTDKFNDGEGIYAENLCKVLGLEFVELLLTM